MKHYVLRFFANGREIKPFFCPDWYGLTGNEIEKVATGVCVGMRCKYKHPHVEVYEQIEERDIFRLRIR